MKLQIAILTDPMASMMYDKDDEYNQIARALVVNLPDVELSFIIPEYLHRVDELADEWDVFVFDWGGMIGMGCDSLVDSSYREVFRLVRKYKDKLFIMYSMFTEEYFKDMALHDFPNLLLPNVLFWQDKDFEKRARTFFSLPIEPKSLEFYERDYTKDTLITPEMYRGKEGEQ